MVFEGDERERERRVNHLNTLYYIIYLPPIRILVIKRQKIISFIKNKNNSVFTRYDKNKDKPMHY